MSLSEPASQFLNAALMHAADELRIGDGWVLQMPSKSVDEVRMQLQAWRDQLRTPSPTISRALVEQASGLLAFVPVLAELTARYPNDADLGGLVRELVHAMPNLLRAHLLLREALE